MNFHKSICVMFLLLLPVFWCTAKNGPSSLKTNSGFLSNVGQVHDQAGLPRPDIDFRLNAGSGLNVFIAKGALHYQWVKAGKKGLQNLDAASTGTTVKAPIDLYRLDVTLMGARKDATVTTENLSTYRQRYYLSSLAADGRISPSCKKVIYHNIYPDIDWILYLNGEGLLEHDFVLRPGARLSDIQIRYDGATGLYVDQEGGLQIENPFGKIAEHAPAAIIRETGKAVPIRFRLKGNILSYDAPCWQGTLVIDPVIDWASYFGGIDNDFSAAVTTSKDGYIYMVGGANSLNNIVTTGAYQTTYGGGSGYLGNDAFLSKFDSLGNCLWSTYYGGSQEDVALAVACDSTGSIFFAGYTAGSAGLASPGAFLENAQGGYDAYLAKFDSTGARLWATYYGGSGDDCYGGPVALACDGANVYLAGSSQSNGLASAGAAQVSSGGYDDAFLVKFNGDGNRLWATYLGGENTDYGYGVAVDATGAVLLTGSTNSTTGIASGGAYQSSLGGQSDAFLARYNASGQKLWSTYLGAAGAEVARSIVTDDASRIYLTGVTGSASGIATTGAYQTTYGGGLEDAFLARFSSGGGLDWLTYYGGSDMDEGLCITRKENNLFVSGLTASINGIATPDAFQEVNHGATDGFIGKFDLLGNPAWVSYYGGVDWDQVSSVAKGTGNDLYVCGYTLSGTGIATTGSHQSIYGGGDGDGFIGRIKDCILPVAPAFTSGDTVVCAGSTEYYSVLPSAGNTYNWTLPSGWQGSSDSASINAAAGSTGGVILVRSVNSCGAGDTTSLAVTVNPSPDIPVITAVGNTLSVATGYASYQWMLAGVPIAGATSPTLTVNGTGVYTVSVTNGYGCTAVSLPYTVTTLGIPDPAKSNACRIYPNPASENLFITAPQAASVNIYTVDGRFILGAVLKQGINEIKTLNWHEGVYLVRIYDGKGAELVVQKIIMVKGR